LLLQLAWEGIEPSWWFFAEVKTIMIKYAFMNYNYYVYYMFDKIFVMILACFEWVLELTFIF